MGNAYRSVLALKPTGDAVPANVLAGKTFSNADGAGKTGTMVNNGAVSVTLTDQDPTYTIPEGYHNGMGVVGFASSGGDGADLVVTCASAYSGLTISCSNGSTTYQKTCPTSSPYQVTFESIPTGTWTISGTIEGQTFSTTILISDFEATLGAIPEGSTVTPTDDIQTWLYCAGIFDKSYTTISEVLSDAASVTALIASNNAVDYMARSTTWATDVCADSSAMTKIGANDYCADSLLADSTWLNAICDSTYFESVLTTKVPTMTSATTPSGAVSASSTLTSGSTTYKDYYAFDGNISTKWYSANNTNAQYLQYVFASAMTIKKFYVKLDWKRTYKVQASTDGSTWVDLISEYTPSSNAEERSVVINNSNAYRYYRLYSPSPSSSIYIGIAEMQFYGRA